MSHGTVQKPLSEGEFLEFAATVMQQLGRGIDPDKARYYIGKKRQLGRDLRKLGIHKMPKFDMSEWERFYAKHFGLIALDFSGIYVPPKPAYPCRAIVVVPQVTNNVIFDACTTAFDGETWRYNADLNTVRDIAQRPDGPYVAWVHNVAETDEDMKNKSAEDIENSGINTMTLKERMLLELKYFDETCRHLDIENITLCAGSRDADGGVPGCHWGGGKFCVYRFNVLSTYPSLRARVVVS